MEVLHQLWFYFRQGKEDWKDQLGVSYLLLMKLGILIWNIKMNKKRGERELFFVENHRIFLGYYLVYLLPFLHIIFLPFCILFVSFLCLSDLYK